MNPAYETLAARIEERFGEYVKRIPSTCNELTFEVDSDHFHSIALELRDEPEFGFEMLVDACGVDYLTYGQDEWTTQEATDSGFSRGAIRGPVILDEADEFDPRRFAVVYHLLSISHNKRLRLRVFVGANNPPITKSVVDVWSCANWFEREVFDMFGILFEGHPDLRRILTDYGFVGHPFRKDFPLSGSVEVHYDAELGRVAYQPVNIEPRISVPRVIRRDNRYDSELTGRTGNDK